MTKAEKLLRALNESFTSEDTYKALEKAISEVRPLDYGFYIKLDNALMNAFINGQNTAAEQGDPLNQELIYKTALDSIESTSQYQDDPKVQDWFEKF